MNEKLSDRVRSERNIVIARYSERRRLRWCGQVMRRDEARSLKKYRS